MLNRYLFIKEETAEELIHQSYNYEPIKTGDVINKFYYVKNYVVVHKKNILLADDSTNVTNEYTHDVMQSLMKLYEKGVSVQPILGYSVNEQTIKTDENSNYVYGSGYMILAKQNGDALYVYDKMPNPFNLNKSENESKKIGYLFERLENISTIPNEHFEKFVKDLHMILSEGLNFDASSQSNILYNKQNGFVFTNISFRLNYSKNSNEFNNCFIGNCFAPCCINFEFTNSISATDKEKLKSLNTIIFNKCKNALISFGVNEKLIEKYSSNIWKN